MTWLAGVIVFASGLWLIGLAAGIVFTPRRAERFLSSFASSARAHYTEQILRLIAGAGMIAFAEQMRYPRVFSVFGWVLAVSAVALLLVPWTWHHRFGQWVIPLAIKSQKLYAIAALALGLFIFYSMW